MIHTPPMEYCRTCKSHRNRRGMLSCNQCGGLFHPECVESEVDPDNFRCTVCLAPQEDPGTTDTDGSFHSVAGNDDPGASSVPIAAAASAQSVPNPPVQSTTNNSTDDNNQGGARRRLPNLVTSAPWHQSANYQNMENMFNSALQALQASQRALEETRNSQNEQFRLFSARLDETARSYHEQMEGINRRLSELQDVGATRAQTQQTNNQSTDHTQQNNERTNEHTRPSNNRTGINDRYQFPATSTPNSNTNAPTSSNAPTNSSAPTISGVPPTLASAILSTQRYEELPKFDGRDPSLWIKFEATYDYQRRIGVDEDRRTSNLISALGGEAYDLVQDRLMLRQNPDQIVDDLRDIYANSDMVLKRLMKEIMIAKPPKEQPKHLLRQFAVLVKRLVVHLTHYERLDQLNNVLLEDSIVEKLRDEHKDAWGAIKLTNPNANLQDMANFLLQRSKDLSAVPPERHPKKSSVKQRPATSLNFHQPNDSDDYASATSETSDTENATVATVRLRAKRTMSCYDCAGSHRLITCRTFLNRSVADRTLIVDTKKICTSCLGSTDHRAEECDKLKQCPHLQCNQTHHQLLHPVPPPTPEPIQTNLTEPRVIGVNNSNGKGRKIIYGVVPLYIRSASGQEHLVYAMIDTGSGITLMKKSLSQKLNLSGVSTNIRLRWTDSDTEINEISLKTIIEVRVPGQQRYLTLNDVHTIDKLDLPVQSQSAQQFSHLKHMRGVPIPEYNEAVPELIIGLPHSSLCAGRRLRFGEDNEPVANKTALGWVVYGPNSAPQHRYVMTNIHESNEDNASDQLQRLERLVRQSMALESFGVFGGKAPYQNRHEKRVRQIVDTTMTQIGDRYFIGLFWKDDNTVLPNSFNMAKGRLKTTEAAVKRCGLLDWTNKKIAEFVTKGFARVATETDLKTPWHRVWYLPIFVVDNPDKVPRKPRIVMDGAATVGGKSLNDFLLAGNEFPASMIGALLRFRTHKYAVTGDVQAMYHQVKIIPEDQQCQRFLWRNGNTSVPPTVYIFTSMTFGLTCSPAAAQLVKNHQARKYQFTDPASYDALTAGTYVDDYLDSQPTAELAASTTNRSIEIMAEINFHLVGFQSNSIKVTKMLPVNNVKQEELVDMDFDSKYLPTAKILGMNWDRANDKFVFRINQSMINEVQKLIHNPTKRQLLRVVMKVFDPLGFLAHVTIRGRMILQHVWREGIDWDDTLPEHLTDKTRKFIELIQGHVERFQMPRWHGVNPNETTVTLHIFTDASEHAMAAVGYFKFTDRDGNSTVSFVFGKAKVMPLKTLTIPRAELTAAVIGVRIGKEIAKLHSIDPATIQYWTDSKCVLAQLNTNRKLQVFQSSRVGEILEFSSPEQWRYVPSDDNPSDYGTKEKPNPFDPNCPWFTGPKFLRGEGEWPEQFSKAEIDSIAITTIQVKPTPCFPLMKSISVEYLNNWYALRRIVARRIRFINVKFMKRSSPGGYITPDEFIAAEDYIFASVQYESFTAEYNELYQGGSVSEGSVLYQLRPTITENGVIRMTSRLENSSVSYRARKPAILPNDHPIVKVYIQQHHDNFAHIGEETIIASLRRQTWILNVRTAVRRIARDCQFCIKRRAKPSPPIMADLPAQCTDINAYPFEHTGMDVFGPLWVSMGRGKAPQKRWVIIFTCLITRAVWFEIIENMTSDITFCAIQNFSTRNGPIKHLYSDLGTNFTGVANELKRIRKQLASKLSERHDIWWHLNPTDTPHFGGRWERLIQSTKKALNVLQHGEERFSDFNLQRALNHVANMMNSRPLTQAPIDPDNLEVLTPNHFINGRATHPIKLGDDSTKYLNYGKVKNLVNSVMKRWAKEYLPTLTKRNKWLNSEKNLEIDDMVLIADNSKPQLQWKMARVTRLFPGKDGVVRVVEIATTTDEIDKKTKLYKLSYKKTGVVNLARLNVRVEGNPAVDGVGNVTE